MIPDELALYLGRIGGAARHAVLQREEIGSSNIDGVREDKHGESAMMCVGGLEKEQEQEKARARN